MCFYSVLVLLPSLLVLASFTEGSQLAPVRRNTHAANIAKNNLISSILWDKYEGFDNFVAPDEDKVKYDNAGEVLGSFKKKLFIKLMLRNIEEQRKMQLKPALRDVRLSIISNPEVLDEFKTKKDDPVHPDYYTAETDYSEDEENKYDIKSLLQNILDLQNSIRDEDNKKNPNIARKSGHNMGYSLEDSKLGDRYSEFNPKSRIILEPEPSNHNFMGYQINNIKADNNQESLMLISKAENNQPDESNIQHNNYPPWRPHNNFKNHVDHSLDSSAEALHSHKERQPYLKTWGNNEGAIDKTEPTNGGRPDRWANDDKSVRKPKWLQRTKSRMNMLRPRNQVWLQRHRNQLRLTEVVKLPVTESTPSPDTLNEEPNNNPPPKQDDASENSIKIKWLESQKPEREIEVPLSTMEPINEEPVTEATTNKEESIINNADGEDKTVLRFNNPFQDKPSGGHREIPRKRKLKKRKRIKWDNEPNPNTWDNNGPRDESEKNKNQWNDGDANKGKWNDYDTPKDKWNSGDSKRDKWHENDSKKGRWNDGDAKRDKWNDNDAKKDKWNNNNAKKDKWNDNDAKKDKWNSDNPKRDKWNDDNPKRDKWNDDNPKRDKWNNADSKRDSWDNDSPKKDRWQDDEPKRDKWKDDEPKRDKWNDDENKRDKWNDDEPKKGKWNKGNVKEDKWGEEKSKKDSWNDNPKHDKWDNDKGKFDNESPRQRDKNSKKWDNGYKEAGNRGAVAKQGKYDDRGAPKPNWNEDSKKDNWQRNNQKPREVNYKQKDYRGHSEDMGNQRMKHSNGRARDRHSMGAEKTGFGRTPMQFLGKVGIYEENRK